MDISFHYCELSNRQGRQSVCMHAWMVRGVNLGCSRKSVDYCSTLSICARQNSRHDGFLGPLGQGFRNHVFTMCTWHVVYLISL
jgi:hypothetical protein